MCHVVGNNGVFPERGSRGPCVGFWGPGSIWQRMWYFCAKFLWIKGVFYHELCVIIYAGRIVPCLHWYLIRVIGRMTSLEWFSIWEASNNIINFNDVRKRLWKLIWLSKVFLLEIRVDWKGLYARSYWGPDSLERVLLLSVDLLGDARDHLVKKHTFYPQELCTKVPHSLPYWTRPPKPNTWATRASFWKHPIVPNHVTHDHTRQNPIMAESALSH